MNILNELSESKKPLLVETINKARIDSREVSKGDIFLLLKGKNDGNKYIGESFKKKASIVVANNINKKIF